VLSRGYELGKDWGEIVIALSALVVAVWTTWRANRDSGRRATLEHLREIDNRLRDVWGCRASKLQENVLAHYRSDEQLSMDGGRYLSFLNAVDLMAFASMKGLIDPSLAHEYTASLTQSPMLSRAFILDLQACCGSDKVYTHIVHLIDASNLSRKPMIKPEDHAPSIQQEKRPLPPSRPPPPTRPPPPPPRPEKGSRDQPLRENFPPIRPQRG
jgi:hypothetical protein